MGHHDYGWISLLPPIAAIVLAIATRRVVLSLLSGVLLGALILAHGDPLTAIPAALESHLWVSLSDAGHLRVFTFTLLMGAMVGVIHRAGGMHGVVDLLTPLARTRRGGQLVTWALGLIVFFDDYANTLLLGGTMQPLTDRLRISREKLAYLVDTTAAPVSGLAIISTWVATEIQFIDEGFTKLQLMDPINGFDIFVRTMPYRFYVILCLLFVPMVAWLGRDFGPMLTAERATTKRNAGDPEVLPRPNVEWLEPKSGVSRRWHNAVIPVLAMIGMTVWLLVATGRVKVASDPRLTPTLFNQFSQGDSYVALLYGSLVGLATAALLAWWQKILRAEQIRAAAFEGARHVFPALAVLWMAWTLSRMTDENHLQTAEYLGHWLEQGVPVALMPTLVFVLASTVSFATGTSWGTMGILMPLAIPVTYRMLGAEGTTASPTDNLMIVTIGSVLAGAIFGDHCSPISDTTVLSSHASGCDHVAHVWTQLPYALTVAFISVVGGTIPAAWGVPIWFLLPVSVFGLWAWLVVFGKRVEAPER